MSGVLFRTTPMGEIYWAGVVRPNGTAQWCRGLEDAVGFESAAEAYRVAGEILKPNGLPVLEDWRVGRRGFRRRSR